MDNQPVNKDVSVVKFLRFSTFHAKFSECGMWALFYKIGLSYAKPTYALDKADPEKQDAFRR